MPSRYSANMSKSASLTEDGADKPAVITVSSLNHMAKTLLESEFPSVIVEGEISNLAIPSSGHWYLSLKDKRAQIRCAMFVNRNRFVRFRPENGQQITVRGKLSIYEGRGDYQLIADSMEEAGDGALQRAFEELKAKLQAEGLFASERKQEVRSDYAHIALITSPTGAAIRDLLSVFARRFPATRLTLIPVAVQGKAAAGEIVSAIGRANRLQKKLDLYAIIVGRGGGSLEDLQAFNEESVARAIAASELPVTSAVGHEIDFTIADFVADLRAPTPSAAAELMSPSQDDYRDQFAGYQHLLSQSIRATVRQHQVKLGNLQRYLVRPDRRLQEHAQTLDRLEASLTRAMQISLDKKQTALHYWQRNLSVNSPQQQLRQLSQRLQSGNRMLVQAWHRLYASHQSSLAALSRSLNATSPLQTLARGYSITYGQDGQLLRNASATKKGARITTRLGTGRIEAIVDKISSSEKPND